MPVFQIDDKFSVDRYKDILKINNFTTAQYEDEIMRLLAIANVEELLFAPVSSMNNNLLKAIMDESKEVRLKLIKINDINGDIVPTNEQLVDKFKENKAQYQTQRKISVDYVELTDESILNTIDVSQELIDNAYTDYVNNTKKAITYSIVQDQLDTEALANESLANLISLDNESSDYKKKAMDVQPGDLGEEMETIIFGMTEGESKVFESSFGWHAVVMSSLNKVVVNTQEQMSSKLRKTLQEEKLLIKKNKMIDEMNAVLYEDGIDALASQFDVAILSIADTTKGFLIWTPESNSKLWKDTEVGGTGILDEANKTIFYSIKSIALPRQMSFEEARILVNNEVLEDMISKKKIELVSGELATENKDDWIKIDISRDLKQQNKLSLLVFGTMDSGSIDSGWIETNGEIFAYITDGVIKQSDLWDSSVFNGIIDREKQQWFSYKKGKEYGIERKE
jgi:peptidyl-prolyl cis-trans isomerase D